MQLRVFNMKWSRIFRSIQIRSAQFFIIHVREISILYARYRNTLVQDVVAHLEQVESLYKNIIFQIVLRK